MEVRVLGRAHRAPLGGHPREPGEIGRDSRRADRDLRHIDGPGQRRKERGAWLKPDPDARLESRRRRLVAADLAREADQAAVDLHRAGNDVEAPELRDGA